MPSGTGVATGSSGPMTGNHVCSCTTEPAAQSIRLTTAWTTLERSGVRSFEPASSVRHGPGSQPTTTEVRAREVMLNAVLVNGAAGYAFAKLRFRGRDRLLRLMLLALVVPGQIGMLPLFLLVRALGLVNTLAGVVIPGLASIFGIFLVRQYALSIPDSILDAARVDGAGEIGIFRRVALPLIAPILATLAVFTFLGAWNDFLWPLVVLADETRYTLPVGLASLAGEHVQDTELMMAGAVVTVAPAVLLFVALQRYYLAGIMGGGVKE